MSYDSTKGTAQISSDAIGFAPPGGTFDTFLKRLAVGALQVQDFLGNPGTVTLGLVSFGNPVDTAFSRLGAGSLALGNGTAGDTSGALTLSTLIAATVAGTNSVSTGNQFLFSGVGSTIISLSSGVFNFRNNGSSLAVVIGAIAPTVTSGFGSTPGTIVSGSTASSFRITVGAGGGSVGVLGLPSTANFWNVYIQDFTTPSVVINQSASTLTSATFTSVTPMVAGDVLIGLAIGS